MRRQYYVRNFDEDDWLQEGRIAVYRAAKKYQRLRQCSFGTYYRVLLSNQIIDHISADTGSQASSGRGYLIAGC
nr:sigma factor [Lactiplantibacillus plantarum]